MSKIRIGIAATHVNKDLLFEKHELARLATFGEVDFQEFTVPSDWHSIENDPATEKRLCEFAATLDILIVCHGSPRVTAAVFAAGKKLKLVGELEGDRFAARIDLEAAHAHGVVVVDTTHGSSWPVSEWALALALLGLREQARFRDIIEGKKMSYDDYRTKPPARELTNRPVGIIGFGHIAWRLCEFLKPFHTPIFAYDPYAPRELADALDVNFASLEKVMGCDVVICLAPDTPKTRGMIGTKEFSWMQKNGVFVNVSRGVVVDVKALEAKAAQNDSWIGIDAHDPEPISVDSPLRHMRNVFLSPHIGGLTAEATPRFFSLMVDEIDRFLNGSEPRAQITARVTAGRQGK